MKPFISLTAVILILGLLVAPAAAEMKPVLVRPVSIDGKYADGIRASTPSGQWAVNQAKKLGVKLTGKTVEYVLTVTEETIDLAGVEFPVWAFGKEGEKGTVPGPTIGAVEGDLIRVTLRNKSRNNHTIHMHGPLTIRYDMDGVPGVAQEPVKPDEQFTYEFVAYPAGTHIYHCHVNANEHMDMGLYGPIVVLPRNPGSDLPKGWDKVDQDVIVMLDEWDSTFSKEEGFKSTTAEQKQSAEVGHPRKIGNYNFFTINGNAFTDDRPTALLVKPGQKVRARVINIGSWPHAMHFHGHNFLVTNIDGYPVRNPQRADTINIIPGERMDLVFEANQEGRWVWHCHIVSHATNDGVYHGGMLMVVVYPDGLDPKKFPLGKPTKISEGGKSALPAVAARPGKH